MLEARRVTLSRGGKTLVEDASFLVGRGEKVGLVGVNGAGKTTLLRALHGEFEPDHGTITRPKRRGYLGQERLADALLAGVPTGAGGAVTVRDAMLAARDLGRMVAELRELERRLESSPPNPLSSAEARGDEAATSSVEARGNDLERVLAR